MQSHAATVSEYLASLDPKRRAIVSTLRDVVLANLDAGIVEGMQYGMIGYAIPHALYPAGYHCDPKQPLPFAGLASQKRHVSLYLMCLYSDPTAARRFQDEWNKTGKKLDMGKCCIRLTTLAGVPLDLIGQTIRRMTVKRYVALYEQQVGRVKPAPTAAGSTRRTEGQRRRRR